MRKKKYQLTKENVKTIPGLQIFVIIATLNLFGNEVLSDKLFKGFECRIEDKSRLEMVKRIKTLINDYYLRDSEKLKEMALLCLSKLGSCVDEDDKYEPINIKMFNEMSENMVEEKVEQLKKPRLKPEKEFFYYMYYHKIATIQTIRSLYNDGVIITERLRKEFEPFRNESIYEVSLYYDRIMQEDPLRLNSLYEYCWRQLRNDINDNKVYSEVVTKELKKDYTLA